MNRFKFIIPVVALLLLSLTKGQTQNCPLSMNVNYIPVTQLSIADVDFEHFESRNLLFTIMINNLDSLNEQNPQLEGKLQINLSDGTVYNEAITFTTEKFSVKPSSSFSLTNLDIGKNSKIKLVEFKYDKEAENRFRDITLSAGKFPAGRYVFTLKLITSECETPPEQIELFLQNISRIELRAPRNGETTNEFPFFEFFYEGERAEIIVAELKHTQTPEDAISQSPAMLRCTLEPEQYFYLYGQPLSNCTYQMRPLENGKTYVWRIISKSRGASGLDIELPSEIYKFTVTSNMASGYPSLLLDKLFEIFGSNPKYKHVLDKIKEESLIPNTDNISLNGSKISLSEILYILNTLRDDENVKLTLD